MSSSRGDLAPQAKNVVLFRNGDPFHNGRRVVVNQRQFLTFEAFLNEVTTTIQAPTAVRYIYTPQQGHRVTQLDALQNGSCYVAAGFEKFQKFGNLNAGMRLPERNRKNEGIQARPAVNWKLNVSAGWRKSIHVPYVIHVFRNGDLLSPPFRLLLSEGMLQQWELILSLLSERANLQTGAVRRTEAWSKHGTCKEGMDSRRVHSTGASEKTQAQTSPLTMGRKSPGKEETSVFYAKPVHVYRSRKLNRISQNGAKKEQESIFKVRASRRELEGAQEVMDDEDTCVELPLDQREAETVADEEGVMSWTRQSHQRKYK
ncbi:doublecortin domain-containing protein 2B isoform X3 [Microcaecilia unicolor]|uniref:Doublecortin domain-containing protein 2B isoform X3 n=1 Tax=Microcaecilia unicolor TaxID=1415580 RepID=A0A6P7ZNA9_9AMPH|nr:doublecortin domain-containing protein 2B isoform X3 [Microcaecilia unicolor]